MVAQQVEQSAAGIRAAVRLIVRDADDRLLEAVRQPIRDDAMEGKLRTLLAALYAAYPDVLEAGDA